MFNQVILMINYINQGINQEIWETNPYEPGDSWLTLIDLWESALVVLYNNHRGFNMSDHHGDFAMMVNNG